MKCEIQIMITDELRLTVTDFYRSPMQKMSYNCEYLPEYFEVMAGYLEDIYDNELTKQDFWEAVDEYYGVIIRAVRNYYYQGDNKGDII